MSFILLLDHAIALKNYYLSKKVVLDITRYNCITKQKFVLRKKLKETVVDKT